MPSFTKLFKRINVDAFHFLFRRKNVDQKKLDPRQFDTVSLAAGDVFAGLPLGVLGLVTAIIQLVAGFCYHTLSNLKEAFDIALNITFRGQLKPDAPSVSGGEEYLPFYKKLHLKPGLTLNDDDCNDHRRQAHQYLFGFPGLIASVGALALGFVTGALVRFGYNVCFNLERAYRSMMDDFVLPSTKNSDGERKYQLYDSDYFEERAKLHNRVYSGLASLVAGPLALAGVIISILVGLL